MKVFSAQRKHIIWLKDKSRHWGQIWLVTMVKLSFGMRASQCRNACFQVPASLFPISLPANPHTLRGNKSCLKHTVTCTHVRRPSLSSGCLALVLIRAGCHGHLQDEPAVGQSGSALFVGLLQVLNPSNKMGKKPIKSGGIKLGPQKV